MSVKYRGTRPVPLPLKLMAATRVTPASPAVRVERQQTPYWREQSWLKQDNVYHGSYQTRYGSVRGMIEDRGWGDLRFYMFDPPNELRRSTHWSCFAPRGKKGFLVHMGTRPKDASSGIMTIERLIKEAIEQAR